MDSVAYKCLHWQDLSLPKRFNAAFQVLDSFKHRKIELHYLSLNSLFLSQQIFGFDVLNLDIFVYSSIQHFCNVKILPNSLWNFHIMVEYLECNMT